VFHGIFTFPADLGVRLAEVGMQHRPFTGIFRRVAKSVAEGAARSVAQNYGCCAVDIPAEAGCGRCPAGAARA